ncbi:hypothetical protein RB195_005758 [Necator americanus]|uniref:Uncharacterized protein n=1 Tax=Necator americanus TaxID=51031 RepID=A0ABR1BT89_NECAM
MESHRLSHSVGVTSNRELIHKMTEETHVPRRAFDLCRLKGEESSYCAEKCTVGRKVHLFESVLWRERGGASRGNSCAYIRQLDSPY